MPAEAAGWRRLLEKSGALRQGHFALSSGKHSPAYVQCALLLEHPARAKEVGEALARRLSASPGGPAPDSILSPAMGGLIVGHEVAAGLGVPFRFAEREKEELVLRRGFTLRPGERVVIVEDVVTTGRSTLETLELARRAGAEAVAVAAIIDRTGGGGEDLLGVPFETLLPLTLPAYDAGECPLCRAGGEPEKPGSRPAV